MTISAATTGAGSAARTGGRTGGHTGAQTGGAIGRWRGDVSALATGSDALREALATLRQPVCLVRDRDGQIAVARGGEVTLSPFVANDDDPAHSDTIVATDNGTDDESLPLLGFAPALHPRQLGDPTFCEDHGVAFPYMTGAMANGIASVELVEAGARAGVLSCYGAAGQTIDTIAAAIDRLQSTIGDSPFAFNLIHSPSEPAHEQAVVDLYLQRGVRLLEASAFLGLTLPAVRYRVAGLRRGPDGEPVAPNRIIAKVSRVEVATKWLSPPPPAMLDQLRNEGAITAEQAQLASRIPMAQDLTAEADSGGHTDNRPAVTLIPTMLALRDRMQTEHGYDPRACPLRVGAAGGIATPAGAAAAFAMGAAYIVTGTVNQACVESGSSDRVRQMLAEAGQADVIMAPAADMFEMGVKLQVLKRGTMFAMRAGKLFELYRAFDSIESLPPAERATLEKTVFRASLDDIWRQTQDYFNRYDPAQVAKAERDGKHRMALIFRWYLGLSSRWANAGDDTRQIDYQVWCGPAMGAFNEWTAGSFLAEPKNRTVETVAMNLLHGAAVLTRVNMVRAQGATLPGAAATVTPQSVEWIRERMSV